MLMSVRPLEWIRKKSHLLLIGIAATLLVAIEAMYLTQAPARASSPDSAQPLSSDVIGLHVARAQSGQDFRINGANKRDERAYQDLCASPPNPIVAENCQPGSDGWIIKRSLGDIEGFASPASINIGEEVKLFVNTRAPRFTIAIYRLGYYGGAGGRLLKVPIELAGHIQPDCNRDVNSGLVSCSNWSSSFSLTIPDNWVSGVYLAKLTRPDTGGESYTLFTVRDDARKSDILVQQSFFTHQAYNNYGGKSVYTDYSAGCPTVAQTPRAVKVSFNRPVITNKMGEDNTGNDYFRAEYPMARWLEAQGYDITYSTTLDTHRSGKTGATNHLLGHRVFLIVGHDEYWTQEMRDAITAARDAGVHLGIFSSNTGYWRVRLESDPFTGEPESVMVVYKTTESGPVDPSGEATGTWRDPAGINNPENAIVGVQYIGDNAVFFPLQVTAEQASDQIYRHTDLQRMSPGTYVNIGESLIGWEWDAVTDNGRTPAGLKILASTQVYGFLLQDAGNYRNGTLGKATTHAARYVAGSGAIIFASGTNLWSWGLGAHGVDIVPPNKYIQQITYNILADMGVQPKTPADTLVLDGATDTVATAPQSLSAGDRAKGPEISDIKATISGDAVSITWTTNVPTIGQLFYGANPEHLILHSAPSTAYDLTHKFTKGYGFEFNSTYYYRIIAVDSDWRVTFSDMMSFHTEQAPLKTQIGQTLRAAADSGKCWVQANPSSAIGIGGILMVGVAFAGSFLALRVRRRRLGNGSNRA
jgi:hypothetical protein